MNDRPEFLYRVTPVRDGMVVDGPDEAEAPVIEEHVRYLSGLAERGVVVLAGRTQNPDPTSFGIVILRAGSEADAREIMENDPAVREGVMKAELFPYRIAIRGEL